MRELQILALISALCLGLSLQAAHADKLKKVSATKYDTRSPSNSFSYLSIEPLNGWRGDHYPEGLFIVKYRSDDKTDLLQGVLDKRGRKPKWMLQPHFEYIEVFNRNSLAAKRPNGETYCILSLKEGGCVDTDFSYLTNLAYRKYQTFPDWVSQRALFIKGEQQHTMDVQLYSRDDRPLAIIRGVMRGLMSQAPGPSEYLPKAYQIGDKLSLRTRGPEGEVRDTLLTLDSDGGVMFEHVPPHAIVEFGDLKYPRRDGERDFSPEQLAERSLHVMTMTNVELGLVWPRYEDNGALRPMPEGLLGLKPIVFEYDAGEYFARYYGDREVVAHVCCTRPLGWAVAWDTPDGARYSLLKQSSLPEFETVASSRNAAVFSDIERLWSPGPDQYTNRTSARRDGNLIGFYAFHNPQGLTEIYSGNEDAGGVSLTRTSL